MTGQPRTPQLRTYRRPDGLFVGTEAALAAFARGDINVMVSRPRLGPDGLPVVNVRLARPEDLRLPGARPARPGVPVALIVAGGIALGVGLGVLAVAVALSWAAAHLVDLTAVSLVVLFVLYLAGATVTRCPGLHCVGCSHRH